MDVVCAVGPYPWTKFFFSDLISFQIIKIIILCIKPFLDCRNALRSKFRREITDYTHNLSILNFIKRDVTLRQNPPPPPVFKRHVLRDTPLPPDRVTSYVNGPLLPFIPKSEVSLGYIQQHSFNVTPVNLVRMWR